jgi:RHS repeat-associated protein
VAIQQNGSELWSTTIAADDYSPKAPAGVDGVAVHAGDRIYFRVQSVFDGAYDQVAWDPEITYVGKAPATDVNGLGLYRYKASEDFVLAGRTDIGVQMPYNGTVHLTGRLQKTGVTTDDVTLRVLRNGTPVITRPMAWDATEDFTLAEDLTVAKGDTLQLQLQADSPVDAGKLSWTPVLYYTASSDVDSRNNPIRVQDQNGNYLIRISPPYDVNLYPASSLSAPQAAWTAPRTGTLTVAPQVNASILANGTLTFTVKKQGALVAKRSLQVAGGSVSGAGAFAIDVTEGDQLYFDFSSASPKLTQNLLSTGVSATYSEDEDSISLPAALHSAVAQGLFGQPYRGWAFAGYNGNRDRATQPIDESLLVLDAGNYQSECDPSTLTTNEALANSPCRPEKAMAYAFAPNPELNAWGGPARNGWVKAAAVSSSRLGAPYISVPRPGQFAGARAVTKISLTSQTAVGAGIGPVSGSYSGDPLDGESSTGVDFLDLNGDSFPDIVGNGEVQYTTPSGGLESSARSASDLDEVRSSRNYAYNVGVGGSPAYFQAGSSGKVDSDGSSAPKGGKNGSSQMVELGLSGELGGGSSYVTADLIDVNGDGLPDRVTRSGSQLMVALNLGYSFAAAEPWGDAAIGDGATRSFSVGGTLGFNAGDYSFAGGLSLAKNESRAGCTLVDPFSGACSDGQVLLDLNGDGLPDRVTPDGSRLRVAFNTGAGFGPEVYWTGALDDAVGIDSDLNFGGGAYFTIGIGPLCIEACYIIINPGFDVSQSMARQELSLMDVDGDGYPDHISSTDDGTLQVARSLLGKANLLKSVSRPLGGSFTLDYERAGNTYADPNSHWVLSGVTTNDGYAADGGDTRFTTYRYEGGYYNRLEREFYGFSRVIEEQRNPAQGNALYRSVVRTYANDSYYSRGLLLTERLEDSVGRPYIQTDNTYVFRDVATGAEVHDLQNATSAIYADMVRTDQRYFEGQPTAPKSTYVTYTRDRLGRTTEMVQSGDVGAHDDLHLSLEYAECPATYLYQEPTRVVMTDDSGTELRRREATVDCVTGDQLQVRESIDGTSEAVTDLAYYANGNLRQVTRPENGQGQRYQLTYEYDPLTATYVTTVTDSFGYRSEQDYNVKFGTLASSTDINGNVTSYAFDAYGRITAVTGPYQQGTGTPTIQFEYHHDAAVPWALTRRIDTFRSATDPIDTVIFSDGEGRVIQTKDDAALHVSPDDVPQDVMIVSGWTIHDFVGRTVAEYYPVTEPVGTPGVLNETLDTVTPTRTVYDVRDRITAVTLPDGAVTSYAYGFGTDRAGVLRFQMTETDPNGVSKQEYRDAGRRVTSLKQFNQGGAETIWTSYDYDPLGQLTRVADDQGNITAAAYDRLGRRIRVESPDAGLTEYRYDPASNLVAEVTPTLRVSGGAIAYRYDFNRLTDVIHPTYPDTDVHYTYGAPGAPENQAGRITQTVDQSGSEAFAYGKLGEVTRRVKTVASDTQGNSPNSPEVYTTQFLYDTFGRLQTLTYPDGEVLTYRYDSGGRLQSAGGVKAGQTYSYIRRYEYDKFGEAVFQEAGNHIRTRYEYDPLNRNLSRLKAGKGEGNLFQNLAYTYDLAGNVLTADNQVPVPPASQFGGPSTQRFTYDDLYRLTSATGAYRYNPDKARRYSLDLTYDSISNITAKAQTDETVQPSGTVIPEGKTSYTQAYTFGGAQPHAPVQIGDRAFRYDAAGNSLGWDDLTNGTRQNIVWDDEYRIRSIFENGQEMTYKYNDQGERVIKRGPQGETVYVNQYYTIRNRTVGTKHIWAGDTRLASKLVKQPRSATATTDGDAPIEKDLYFYHADREGNSGYVTDNRGKLYQHTEYFPFGEIWLQEKSNTQRTPYLFAGKELDEETGLYYFGARYYDPQTSLWQSTDPILNDYLSGQPGGGVYNPANLQLYGYADQNPITYTDPNGEAVYRVPYFGSAYSKWARDKRKLKSYGGRNLATLAYLEADGVTRGYKTKASDGFHSEKRLYDWFQANCAGCTVRWLYTELAPCGSDVHNCSNRVQNWWPGIDVYYSIEYPNHDEVNAVSTQSGANRTLTQRYDIAQERRARAVKVLKMFGREVRRRHLKGLAMAGKHKFRKGSTNYVDESDVEMGISNK